MRMDTLLDSDAYHNLLVELTIQAKRFGLKSKIGNFYSLNITHSELASMAGITRETVSRQIKILEKDRIVMRKGKGSLLVNLDKLEQKLA